MGSILIKNGVLTDDVSARKADLLIENGLISKIGENIESKDAKVIDASGMLVMPGIIDAHTHYHLVSRGTVTCDGFHAGSRLAAFGGVTTVVDFADHNKGQDLIQSLEYRQAEMAPMAIDYTLHQGVYGHGYNSTIGKQLEVLKSKGVKTLKIFTTYRNTGYLIEKREDLLDLFQNAKRVGMLVCAHCEFNPMIEEISENRIKASFAEGSLTYVRNTPEEAFSILIDSINCVDKFLEELDQIYDEYCNNVQSYTYERVMQNLPENMEVEKEEVMDDNSILITLNVN